MSNVAGLFDRQRPIPAAHALAVRPEAPPPLAVPPRHLPAPVEPTAAAVEPTGIAHIRRGGKISQADWQAEIRSWLSGHPADRIGFAANYADLVALLVASMPLRIVQTVQGRTVPVDRLRDGDRLAHRLGLALSAIRGSRLSQVELFTAWHRSTFTVGELFLLGGDQPGVFDPVACHLVETRSGRCTVRWTEDSSRRDGPWEEDVDEARLFRSYRSRDGSMDCTSPISNGLVELRGYALARERLQRISKTPAVVRAWLHGPNGQPATAPDPLLNDYYATQDAHEMDPTNPLFDLPLFVRKDTTDTTELVDLAGTIDQAAMDLDRHWAERFAATQSGPSKVITGAEGDAKFLNGVLDDDRLRERLLYVEGGWFFAEVTKIAFRPLVARLVSAGLVPGHAESYSIEIDREAFEHARLDPKIVLSLYSQGLLSREGAADLMGINPSMLLDLPDDVTDWDAVLAVGGRPATLPDSERAVGDPDTGGGLEQLPPRPTAAATEPVGVGAQWRNWWDPT